MCEPKRKRTLDTLRCRWKDIIGAFKLFVKRHVGCVALTCLSAEH